MAGRVKSFSQSGCQSAERYSAAVLDFSTRRVAEPAPLRLASGWNTLCPVMVCHAVQRPASRWGVLVPSAAS